MGDTNFTNYHELILPVLNSCKLVKFVSVLLSVSIRVYPWFEN